MVSPKRAIPVLLLAVAGLAFLASWRSYAVEAPVEPLTLDPLYAAPGEYEAKHVIARGETLDRVLGRVGITGTDMSTLLLALREHANPRRIRAGSEVTFRRWTVEELPRTVELQLNPDTILRLERSASGWDSRILLTPVTWDTLWVAGTVERNQTLYRALVDDAELELPRSERILMVSELAEIYGYKLDFSREIQAGDRFRFVYEREIRPDGSSRHRRVLAAEIENRGARLPAIFFQAYDERGGYYDLEGKSLRLAFRRYPVDYVRITSAFSWRRYHPVLGGNRPHLGTDFGAPTGTPVRATSDGTVASAGWNSGGYGNLIVLSHPGGYRTRYAHLSRFAPGIRAGRRVEEGQVIGYVGATGLATGPHVHYEIWRGGQALDPRTAQLPGAPPVPEERMDEFRETAERRIALLDRGTGGPHLALESDSEGGDGS